MFARLLLLLAGCMVVVGPALAGGAEGPSYPTPEPPEEPEKLGAGIQRSMALMATSTPRRRHSVKVLFYGQSITVQDWWKEVAADLRRRFPHADLTIENRALGGFASQYLVKTAEQDLYPFYPDLLVFHVYGDHRRYEDIIARTRRRTTAEIAIWNDHVTKLPTPEQEEKGMVGGGEWSEKMSYEFIPGYAREYGCYLMDIRTAWRRYLDRHGLEPSALLRDGVHLNEWGSYVLAELIKARLAHNPQLPDASRRRMVRTYAVGEDIRWENGKLTMGFEGNRVDAISAWTGDGEAGCARVLIDGRQPSDFPALYAFTRPSNTVGVGWPAIMRVGWEKPRLVEEWTARIRQINEDHTEFSFEVVGSRTGYDGNGNNQDRFVSDSGRVVIEPDDWHLKRSFDFSKEPTPVGFEVKWRVVPMFVDVYRPREIEDPTREYSTTLAQGLPNARHNLELVSEGDAPVPIRAIRVYEPPVR
ncbi:MAG: hypothetical protein PVJ27_06495 [Candidatus Brocadiaceae bacterium]|jgi:hypothetical protein